MNEKIEEMTLTEIRNEIVRFNNDSTAQRLKRYYNEKTFPEILSVSRRELSHSSFLAWMLDPQASHGIGDFGLRRLLEILMTSKLWQSQKAMPEVFDDLITGNFQLQKASVEREVSLGSNGRVDILIELQITSNERQSRVRLIVENKVLSTEGEDQTNKYYKHFTNLADGFENLFVYLTPISSLELVELSTPECENKNFIQTNYQALVDSLLEPSLDQSIDAATKIVITQYIQSLSQPSMDEEENDFERGMIMAIGKEERELLQKFWANNQKIIQASLYAISSDPNQEKDVRDNVREALSSIATTGKDRSSITIKYDGAIHARIQKSDLGYETIKLLASHGLINEEAFEWLAKDTSCSFKLLKTPDEVTETEAKYRKYRIKDEPELNHNGIGYYVARNWGIGNIYKFITKLEARFPKLSYVVETKNATQ